MAGLLDWFYLLRCLCFCLQLEAGIQEAGTGSDLLGKSLQSAIDNSGATPTSGATVEGKPYSYLITFPLYSYLFSSHYLLSVADRFLSPLSPPAVVDEAKGSEELADGIGQEVHQGVKERLQSDPDYNSEQFPSAEKVFQPNQ